MSDDNTVNDQEQADDRSPEQGPADKHSTKEGLREGAAKVFGLAVEVGSILGGSSGEIVSAEREVAEAEAEEFIDRVDGEG